MFSNRLALALALLASPAVVSAQSSVPPHLLGLADRDLEQLISERADEIRRRASSQYGSSTLRPNTVQTRSDASIQTRPASASTPAASRAASSTRAATSLTTQAVHAAEALGIPAHLALGLITVESGWKPRAVSPKGAIGLTQVMPGTAQGMNITCDLFEPSCNLRAGLTYLRRMLDQFRDPRLALAAYIGGPGVFSRRYSQATRQDIESYVRNVIVTANRLAPGQATRGSDLSHLAG